MKITSKDIIDYVNELVLTDTISQNEVLNRVRLRFVAFGIDPALEVAKGQLKVLNVLLDLNQK